MITPAYSPTATERVLPRMALDFTTGVLDPRVTFTRASTATFVGSNGLIQTAAINAPRFDYSPSTLAPKGLLIEEQRANLFVQSQFQASWTANAGTTTFLGTYVTSPDGTDNGRILNDTSAAAAAYVFQSVSFTSGTVYTLSVYVKKGVSRYFALTSFTQSGRALFDLNNYSLSSVTGIVTSATITDAGGGWYRCTATMTASATGANNLGFGDFEAGPTGDLYYLWGAQIEAGAFATSYIPTVASQATRNPDLVSMTGTNFSDWYNASEGAVFVQIFRGDATGSSRGAWRIDSGATNNGMDYRPYGSNNTVNISGASQVDIYPGGGVANSVVRNVFGYKVNNFAAATNGGAAVTDTLGNLPTVNQMVIGGLSSATGQILCGHVQKMSYWPQRLTEAEIRAFSK